MLARTLAEPVDGFSPATSRLFATVTDATKKKTAGGAPIRPVPLRTG
jgi:hypothetical protein